MRTIPPLQVYGKRHQLQLLALTTTVASVLLLCTTACSGVDGSEWDDWQADSTGEASEGAVSTIAQELSASDSCDTVSANKTTWGWPADFVTGSNYGTTGCSKAYRIDADAYLGYDWTSEPRRVHWFSYADSVTVANCGRIRFGFYIWEGGHFLGSRWEWGRPMTIGGQTYGCIAAVAPVVAFDLTESAITTLGTPNNSSGGLRINQNFRFAMSARLYNTARDSSSAYVTKPIRSWTAERGDNDTW